MTNPVSLRRHLPARRPAHTEAVPTPNAARQRRYRRRLRKNLLTAHTEMPLSLVEKLVAAGVLDESAATDAEGRGAALVAIALQWVRGMAKKKSVTP